MNRIYWDLDRISVLTDTMDASSHSHAMMQFFICTEGKLNLKVGKERPDASCILVNKNVRHSFKAGGKICLTVMIEPVSDLGLALDVFLGDKDHHIVDQAKAEILCLPRSRTQPAEMTMCQDAPPAPSPESTDSI